MVQTAVAMPSLLVEAVEAASTIAVRKDGTVTARCPAHRSESQTVAVNGELDFWFCFDCGRGGDLDSWTVMAHPGAHAEEILKALAWAAEWYRAQLIDPTVGSTARDYLSARLVRPGIGEEFSVGYSPDDWDAFWVAASAAEVGTEEVLTAAGLVFRNRAGKVQDRFRNRIMFPIRSQFGRVIGFGGRTLSEEPDVPKYVNTSETPAYQKSTVLYNLDAAVRQPATADKIIICEGYLDVVAFAQAGIWNAVATCGTAMTEQHIATLSRVTRRLCLAFDSDEAGQKAVDAVIRWAVTWGLEVEVVILDNDSDPGDYMGDRELLVAAVDQPLNLVDYQIRRTLAAGPFDSIETSVRAMQSLVESVAPIRTAQDHRAIVAAGLQLGLTEWSSTNVAEAQTDLQGSFNPPTNWFDTSRFSLQDVALRLLAESPHDVRQMLDECLFTDDFRGDLYRLLSLPDGIATALRSAATDSNYAGILLIPERSDPLNSAGLLWRRLIEGIEAEIIAQLGIPDSEAAPSLIDERSWCQIMLKKLQNPTPELLAELKKWAETDTHPSQG